MNKKLGTIEFGEDGHPAIETLLLFVESELTAKDHASIRAHVETCWSCRAHTERMNHSISAFVQYRDEVFTPLAASAADRQNFQLKLNRLTVARPQKSFYGRVREHFGKVFFSKIRFEIPSHTVHRLFAGATAALVIIALVWLLVPLDPATTVSASELLRKSAAARAEQLRRVEEPVVRQKIEVRRKAGAAASEDAINLEIWHDATNNRFRETILGAHNQTTKVTVKNDSTNVNANGKTIDPKLAARLAQILKANAMTVQHLLRAAAFQTWRASLPEKTDHIARLKTIDNGDVIELRTVRVATAAVDGEIIENALLVRASDWHPVEQRIVAQSVEGTEAYRFVETEYEVIARKKLSAAVFDYPGEPTKTLIEPSAPSSVQKNAAAVVSPLPSPAQQLARTNGTIKEVAPPSDAELAAAEIAARHALHRAGADLGEPVEVVREANAVVVRGLAETTARKQELLGVLDGLPHVAVNIQTVDEAERTITAQGKTTQPKVVAPVEESADHAATKVQTAEMSIENELKQHFGGQTAPSGNAGDAVDQKIAQLSRDATARAQSLTAEAWALRRLAERYTPIEIGKLQPADKRRLIEIAGAHAAKLRAHGRALRQLVESPLARIAAGERATPGGRITITANDLKTAVENVFAVVTRVNRSTNNLFAGANAGSGSAKRNAAELLASLPELENELRRLEALIAKY